MAASFGFLFCLCVSVIGLVNGATTSCIPDVVLPKSCNGRRAMDIPSQVSIADEITYILYTPKIEPYPVALIVGNDSILEDAGYNIHEETKIIVHGYYSSAKNFEHMVFAYMTATDHNIILMDWSGLAKWCYCEHVLKNVERVGKELGKLIKFLVEKGTPEYRIHLIGHSLGSHIVGIASINSNKRVVGRITALDPARPGFSLFTNEDRLHKSRADIVDAIHTNAHVFGIAEPIGHYDFYPNGGQGPQPGCSGVSSEMCSHSRAHYLYAESINTDVGFRGISCGNWSNYLSGECGAEGQPHYAYMGARLHPNSMHGVYYLKTGSVCPYFVLGMSTSTIVMPSLLTFITILIQVFQ